MKKIFLIFGTRPEAIKMAPVVKAIEQAKMKPIVVSTGQHHEMLYQVLDLFKIKPYFELDVMQNKPDLFNLTSNLVRKLKKIFAQEKADLVLVQGDTTSTFIGALSAFYSKVPVGYVESGLRSFHKYQPFPEEMNRVLTTRLADLHFVPTSISKQNLIREGIDENMIHTVGNTVIDSLQYILKKLKKEKKADLPPKYILVTAHRRENWGSPIKNICKAVADLSENLKDMHFLFSVHKNPAVRKTVNSMLGNNSQVQLMDPVEYSDFIHLMSEAAIILSDSGGIQEEVTALGKPLLVLRDRTERPEGLTAGTTRLVGTDPVQIVNQSMELLNDPELYSKMAHAQMLYGKGDSSKKIAQIISKFID